MRALAASLLLAALAAGCGGQGAPREEAAVSGRPIDEVLAAHTDSLMSLPGVVGTAMGLCDSTPCIRVFLADSNALARAKLPAVLEGYQVRAEVTGEFRPR